jgi:putative ABC transport system permease protein
MISNILRVLLSHWLRKPGQFATLLVGLALATALWTGVKAINAEATASYDQAAATLGQDQLNQLVRADGEHMDQQSYINLRLAGWLVSPVLEGEIGFSSVRLRLLGIDPLTMPPEAQSLDLAGGEDLLTFITSPGLVYVGPETATRLADKQTPPLKTIKGIPPGTMITDIGQAQGLLKAQNKISRLLVWETQTENLVPVKTIAPDLILREPAQAADFSRLTDSFHLNLTAFGFLAFLVGLFIVYSAIGLAFEQRRSMFRTLRALGVSLRALMLVLVAELLLMSLLAGAIGVVLGYLVAVFLLPDVASTLQGLYGVDLAGTLTVRPSWWLAGLAIAVCGTLVASAQNLLQVWTMPILAPAQPHAWAKAAARSRRWQGTAAAVLLMSSLALLAFGQGLFAGFAILATMVLGASLLLPLFLSSLLSLGERMARNPIAAWFWADTRQQLSGQSMALMALLLALATNIGVGTMVSSFRQTFVSYLDQRLASELYVSGRSESEADAMRAWLLPRSEAVLPIWNVDGKVADQPVQIFGVVDHETYRKNWPMLSSVPDVWERLSRGDGVLINEQMSRRQKLNVGAAIALPGAWQSEVLGVYSDYGNPIGQVIVGFDQLNARYKDVSKLRYGIRVQQDQAAKLADDLRNQFNLPATNIVNQADIKAFSLDVFERTFTVTTALNVLTLGVAAIAMFASLMTLAEMRLPQLAPVWALGLTRRRLAALEFLRSLMLAALTLVAALPLGLALAWVLLAIVNVEAFGWRLPMFIFPAQWAWLGLLGLVASAIAAAFPVRRLARIAPSDLLKVFANER